MSTKAGVWIDHKQAILVLLTDTGKEIKRIASGIERPIRTRSHNSYTPNDYVAEDRLQRKSSSQSQKFFDEVIASVKGAEALLILGPGEAKGEFHKRLMRNKLRGLIVELNTADKMTDRQLAAKVGEHFATKPTKNSPKTTAKNRSAKSKLKKPTKGPKK
jgi:hypothetical protein